MSDELVAWLDRLLEEQLRPMYGDRWREVMEAMKAAVIASVERDDENTC